MSQRLSDHVWILFTVILATYSQLVMKGQMNQIGPLPLDLSAKLLALIHVLMRPWVITALAATLLSGICWMVTLTKFDLSYAFPFTALSFPVMFMAGVMVFGEQASLPKLLGTMLVLCGVLLVVVAAPEQS